MQLGVRPRSLRRDPCKGGSFSEGDRSCIFLSSCISSCLEVQNQIILVVSESMVESAVACFSRRCLSQAGLCYPFSVSIWQSGDWCCIAVGVQPYSPVVLPWYTSQGLQITGFLGIPRNHRNQLPELPLHTPLFTLQFSSQLQAASPRVNVQTETPMLTGGLLLLEELNHHLEWHSLSEHKNPGAGTITFVPSIIACWLVPLWKEFIIMPWAHITMPANHSPYPAQTHCCRKRAEWPLEICTLGVCWGGERKQGSTVSEQ